MTPALSAWLDFQKRLEFLRYNVGRQSAEDSQAEIGAIMLLAEAQIDMLEKGLVE